MAERMKNMNVEAGVMARLVELKKGYGLRSLSAVINYLLDLVPAQERYLVSQRVELKKEYREALAACKKLRELVNQPIQPAYETKPLRAVITADSLRLTNLK
jgi:predicted CopG family antitoxin